MTGILSSDMSAVPDQKLTAASDKTLTAVGLVKDGRKVGVMLWVSGSIPGDALNQETVKVTFKDVELDDPVWVEPLTGRVCELGGFSSRKGDLIISNLPVWDSPVFVIERSEIRINP